MSNRFKSISLVSLFAFAIILIVSVLSCEIGLGESVDVNPPTITITYPPNSAVVRENFVLAGECDDDKGVVSVTVSATNSMTGAIFGPYTATLVDDGKSWQVSLNSRVANVWGGGRGFFQMASTPLMYTRKMPQRDGRALPL